MTDLIIIGLLVWILLEVKPSGRVAMKNVKRFFGANR